MLEASSQVFIALDNPKSPTNVGAVMRAVGCYQASEVRYTGERFNRAVKYQTDTHNVNNKVPLTHVDDLLGNRLDGMQVVCIELVEGATSLPTFKHPQQALYVFGPEDGSLTQGVIDQADHVVYVPTFGCMNLAASVNVVLYDRMAKSSLLNSRESTIKMSRDANNRLKVK